MMRAHREPCVSCTARHRPVSKPLTLSSAERFDVPVDFLLNKVAYLTEQHASQVRAQVRKATAAAKGSPAPSPVPGADSAGMNPRTTSALSVRRDSPMPRPDANTVSSFNSVRPAISRNASGNTSVQRDRDSGGSSSRHGKPAAGRLAEASGRRRLSSLPITSTIPKSNRSPEPQPERSPSPGPAESSSTSTDSEAESLPVQSRIIRRPPRFQQQDGAASPLDDDDDESEPAFQPYRAAPTQSSGQDLASTLRGDGQSSKRSHKAAKEPINYSHTSDSSTGSAAMVKRPGVTRETRTPGPLSPRRATELAGRSPSSKGKGYSREGSDGTPSMGSSFSDLDGNLPDALAWYDYLLTDNVDASVTQSALEEALASHMKAGGGSRFGISQAFRSRYNPSSNQ